MPLAEDKKRLRTQAEARRARGVAALAYEHGAADRLARNYLAAMAAMGHPEPGAVVSGFWPMGGEIDVRPLLIQLHGQGYRCALPVVTPKGTPLVFRAWAPDDTLEPGKFGTSHPPAGQGELTPDVVLAPLLAFDVAGYRLGYGGGYYDRTLAMLRRGPAALPQSKRPAALPQSKRNVLAVGIAYSFQQVESVPHGAEDQRLDWVVTEERIFACGTETREDTRA